MGCRLALNKFAIKAPKLAMASCADVARQDLLKSDRCCKSCNLSAIHHSRAHALMPASWIGCSSCLLVNSIGSREASQLAPGL